MDIRSLFLHRYTQIIIATAIAFPYLVHLLSGVRPTNFEFVFLIATTIFAIFSFKRAHPLTKPFFQQLMHLMLFATSYTLAGLLTNGWWTRVILFGVFQGIFHTALPLLGIVIA